MQGVVAVAKWSEGWNITTRHYRRRSTPTKRQNARHLAPATQPGSLWAQGGVHPSARHGVDSIPLAKKIPL
jgi:hypothetical protein